MTPNPVATTRTLLREWTVELTGRRGTAVGVVLPHDAMLGTTRSASAPGGADTGWFEGGRYTYRAVWTAPPRVPGQLASLLFEGVQGDAAVFVNDIEAGIVRGGYAEAELAVESLVRWGGSNDIEVRVDHSNQPSERWYPGSGLYRDVAVVLRPFRHFASDGLRVVTTSINPHVATLDVAFTMSSAPAEATVTVELRDGERLIDTTTVPVGVGLARLTVPQPRPWSAEDPFRYRLTARAATDLGMLDERSELVGLRTVAVDAKNGLRINGVETLLRGACVHHDNGPLGAATHRAAEFRRVRLLKEAGFNALRSAHNPASRHLLDACDELGMYVLEELADYWFVRKTRFDHSDRFRATWREDAAATITKDRNRASVIMYAIGNEIPETALSGGVDLAREITAFFHDTDPTRPVTLAINLFVNTLVTFGASPYAMDAPDAAAETSSPALASSTEANAMVNHIGKMMHFVARLPRADRASRDAFGVVDVAGYNYGLARYRGDVKRYPHRVILGTETLPGDVAWAWRLVKQHPQVIGDFVWAGWEYLGEAGVSVWVPGKKAGMSKPYPYVVSGPGMFDLTGRPDASLRLAQAAWGHLTAPVITVRPLDRSGVPHVRSAWRVTDAVESWSWAGSDGKTADIEIYSNDDEVELILNGRSLGRHRVGRKLEHRVRFRAQYEPGTLVAVGYRGKKEFSRSELSSADQHLRLRIRAENPTIIADGEDLAFVHVELSDLAGNVEMLADEAIRLTVTGPAELLAFASAAPATEESFLTAAQRTYRGRALAIVRSTGEEGTVRVHATSETRGIAQVELTAVPATSTASAAPSAADVGLPR